MAPKPRGPPPGRGGVIRSYLFSPEGVRTHGWGPWNPCRVDQLDPGEQVESRGRDGAFHVATVVSHWKHKVTIQFPDGLADLRDSADFRFPSELDLDWSSSDHAAPSPSLNPNLTASALPLPY